MQEEGAGASAAGFWARKKFKGTNALKRKVNPTCVPIEQNRWLQNLQQARDLLADPQRCVHIGEGESDIHELNCAAKEANTHFLVPAGWID